jgi:hypothetical protein
MKKKRNQKDDRQWKSDQPNKRAFYRSHPNLPPGSNGPLQFWFPDGVAWHDREKVEAGPTPA